MSSITIEQDARGNNISTAGNPLRDTPKNKTPLAEYSCFVLEGRKLWNTLVQITKDDLKGAPNNSYVAHVTYHPTDMIKYEESPMGRYLHSPNLASFGSGKKATFRFVHDREKDMGEEVTELLEEHQVSMFGGLLRGRTVMQANAQLLLRTEEKRRLPRTLLERRVRPPEPA